MTTEFEFEQLVLPDLTQLEPGSFFWIPNATGQPLVLSLLVQPFDDRQSFRFVDMQGEFAFQIRAGRLAPPGQQYVLKAPWADTRVAIGALATQPGGTEQLGDLLVTDVGGYLVTKIATVVGFADVQYVSLSDWSVAARTPRTYYPIREWHFIRPGPNGSTIPLLGAPV